MKIELIKLNSKPITIGVGPHTFPIEDDKVCKTKDQEVGCRLAGLSDKYEEAFELASFAWDNKVFDNIIER